jgi:UDP:flavonoid glycosyltransferase YjiC (YdhE family)
VPSVVVPHNADQFTWARRMAELGVSPSPIPRRRLTLERLEPAIRRATTSGVLRERAQAIAESIREENGVGRAVEVFEGRFGDPPQGAPAAPHPRSAVVGEVR